MITSSNREIEIKSLKTSTITRAFAGRRHAIGGRAFLQAASIITVAVFMNSPVAALAQTTDYTLERTIQEALNTSTDMLTATRQVEIDRKQTEVELARLKPGVSVDAAATRYDDKTSIAIGGVPPITVLKDHSEAISLGVSLDLDLFGQVKRAASQFTLQSLSDKMNLVTIKNQRILLATTVYYDLLRAEHQVQVAQAALATAVQQQSIATKLNLGQVGQKIDVLRANTQVANSQQDLTTTQNNFSNAQNNFNDLVGRALDAPVHVQDIPGVTGGINIGEVAPSDATVAAAVAASSFTVDPQTYQIDVSGAVKSAITRRPEVLSAQIQVRLAETGIQLARGGLDPSLSLVASGNYYPTTSFQAPRQSTAELTINLRIPLYDGGATRARTESARLQADNTRSILDRRKKDVALEVRQDYLNLVSAGHQIDAANTGLTQAIAARKLAQARYEGQVGIYLEITDAQSALVQAENSQINAVYGFLEARARYENATGAPVTK